MKHLHPSSEIALRALLPTWHHFAALAPKLQDFVVPNERCTSQWHCVLVQTFPQNWLVKGWGARWRGKHGMKVCFFGLRRWDVDWFEGTVLYTLFGMERRFGRSLETLGESVCFFFVLGGSGNGMFYVWGTHLVVFRKGRWRVKSIIYETIASYKSIM